MKKGWEIKRLDEVCTFINGRAYSKEELLNSGKYLVLRVGNFFTNTHWYYSDLELPEDKYCDNGDLLYAWSASFGPRIWTGGKVIYHYHIWKIIPNSKLITKEFLYLLLDWDTEKIKSDQGTGTTMMHVGKGSMEARILPIPPLPEQQRIVAILDEAFASIDKAKANAEQNLKNAKELFESYLQSVFENKGEGWKAKTLGDVCSLYQGIAINAKTKHALVEKSNLPLLRIKDLKNNTVEQYIDPNNFPANALVNESDIIYTRTGSLGLVFRGRRGVLHNNSFKVVPNFELDKDFLFIWLQNPIFKSKIMELALKAAQPDITHAIFKVQKIVIPPLLEQQTIVEKLDALSVETKKLESIYQQKINDLEELKKSILQKAFNGELNTAKEVNI